MYRCTGEYVLMKGTKEVLIDYNLAYYFRLSTHFSAVSVRDVPLCKTFEVFSEEIKVSCNDSRHMYNKSLLLNLAI